MSWQLGAGGILAIALAAGFAWYERSRPDARMVALVATMAALAALGRIAFAALPNVKPTTDIVLITGYALGGAPGFVVGAVSGLVSNFFFGQGPWTVWQMTAWAATGLLGAGLARVWRGPINRWALTAVCFPVGFAFTAFQDVGDWVNYSDHSVSQLVVYTGKGVGFDLVHASGCAAFAFAFGPALMRSLQRFTRRLHVRWEPAGAPRPAGGTGVLPTILIGVAVAALTLSVTSEPARAAATPAAYLVSAQNADGGFGDAPGAGSAPELSGWTALGLAAQGQNPGDVRRGGVSLLDYIRSGVPSIADAGSVERTLLIVGAAGENPRAFGGRDLLSALRRDIRTDGSVSGQVNLTAFAILALRAVSAPVPGQSVDWLAHQQNSDGGFGFAQAGTVSDVDDTGAVLEALAGARSHDDPVINRAVGFIGGQQNDDGGFPSAVGGLSDAQSTAWAMQGLLAVGRHPRDFRAHGHSPFDYLRSLIAPDGHIRYAAGNDQTPVWVTAQALMALDRKPLPLAAVPAAPPPFAAPVQASPKQSAAATAPRRPAGRGKASRPAKTRSVVVADTFNQVGAVLSSDAKGILDTVVRALAPLGL